MSRGSHITSTLHRRLIDAIRWRHWYYRTVIGGGILARALHFPRTFFTTRDAVQYARAMASLCLNKREISIRVMALAEHPLFCRCGTSDPWVLWDVFHHKYHLPPHEIPNGGFILDLGANVGYTAAHFAALYPTVRVLAVEMDEANARLAAKNTARFGDRCTIVHAAVWDDDTIIRYDGTSDQAFRIVPNGSSTCRRQCVARTIASLLRQYRVNCVDYLKMDIEGAEARVFEASLDWASCVRSMKIELHPPAEYSVCAAALHKAGFDCWKDDRHPRTLLAIGRKANGVRPRRYS